MRVGGSMHPTKVSETAANSSTTCSGSIIPRHAPHLYVTFTTLAANDSSWRVSGGSHPTCSEGAILVQATCADGPQAHVTAGVKIDFRRVL